MLEVMSNNFGMIGEMQRLMVKSSGVFVNCKESQHSHQDRAIVQYVRRSQSRQP